MTEELKKTFSPNILLLLSETLAKRAGDSLRERLTECLEKIKATDAGRRPVLGEPIETSSRAFLSSEILALESSCFHDPLLLTLILS